MKTIVTCDGCEITIEELDGKCVVTANQDGEVVEEFTLNCDGSESDDEELEDENEVDVDVDVDVEVDGGEYEEESEGEEEEEEEEELMESVKTFESFFKKPKKKATKRTSKRRK